MTTPKSKQVWRDTPPWEHVPPDIPPGKESSWMVITRPIKPNDSLYFGYAIGLVTATLDEHGRVVYAQLVASNWNCGVISRSAWNRSNSQWAMMPKEVHDGDAV
jgi:hypothetical protein